jgi:hypothetical protein
VDPPGVQAAPINAAVAVRERIRRLSRGAFTGAMLGPDVDHVKPSV